MEVIIRPKNFKLQSDVETQIRKRLDKLSRYLESLESCEVVLSQEPTHFNAQRVQHVVQLTIRTRNNSLIRTEVADADLLTAMDEAMDRLTRQVERFKGRFYQKKKGKQGIGKSSASVVAMHPGAVEDVSTAEAPVAHASTPDGAAEEEEPGEIVRVKRFNMEPMYPDEALERMELLGHSFFVFFNAGEDSLNVLYRRSDGNYGLLQPELG